MFSFVPGVDLVTATPGVNVRTSRFLEYSSTVCWSPLASKFSISKNMELEKVGLGIQWLVPVTRTADGFHRPWSDHHGQCGFPRVGRGRSFCLKLDGFPGERKSHRYCSNLDQFRMFQT